MEIIALCGTAAFDYFVREHYAVISCAMLYGNGIDALNTTASEIYHWIGQYVAQLPEEEKSAAQYAGCIFAYDVISTS